MMKRAERIERAIKTYEKEIDKKYKELRIYSREELLELAQSYGLSRQFYIEEHYRKTWIQYDIAVKAITGYTNYSY